VKNKFKMSFAPSDGHKSDQESFDENSFLL
jgi:hypothetical protein